MVLSAEWMIISINLIILYIAYYFVYPRFAGSDLNRLLVNDLLANITALVVAGALFYGSGQRFDFVFFELGWFGFTLLSFVLLELPFFWSYARRYRLFEVADRED
jgi:hypothetical protein